MKFTPIATLGVVLYTPIGSVRAQVPTDDGNAAISTMDSSSIAHELSAGFADIAERVAPTTVLIDVEASAAISVGLQQMYRDYGLSYPSATADGRQSGSGVIIDEDGLILTNHHVVGTATRIRVTLHDGRVFDGTLVGSDPRTDIALVRIFDPQPFPAATRGDSDRVRVGEWVMAVGHPFEFDFTVSTGIISAIGRRHLGRDEIHDYLQTDATLHPGSSGGPLFDLRGTMIGLNTAIYSQSDGTIPPGISFAIPSNMAWSAASELLESGEVTRASLGILTRERPPTAHGSRPGLEILHLHTGGAAEVAGLRIGDIIVSIDGEPVARTNELRSRIRISGDSEPLRLEVIRAGNTTLMFDVYASYVTEARGTDLEIPRDATLWAGLTLAPSTTERTEYFGTIIEQRNPDAPIVLRVEAGSPGAGAGILPGDLLTHIRGEPVHGPTSPARITGDRSSVVLSIRRSDGSLSAVVSGLGHDHATTENH